MQAWQIILKRLYRKIIQENFFRRKGTFVIVVTKRYRHKNLQ